VPAAYFGGADGSASRETPLEALTDLVRGARPTMAGRSFSVDQWSFSDPIGEKAASDRRLAQFGLMGRAIFVQQEMVEAIEGPESAWSRRELLLTSGDGRYRSSVLADDASGNTSLDVRETVICDGQRVWTFWPPRNDGLGDDSAATVHWRRAGRAELGLAEMTDPIWLLKDYDLAWAGDAKAGHKAEFGGRICYEGTAVPRGKSELIPADDPCDRIDLLVDVETGVLLRLARVIDDRDYQIREWADFAPDADYTDDAFAYTPDPDARLVEDDGGMFGDVPPVLAKAAHGVASLLKLGRSKG
jgi:hypothetical protein